MSFGSAKSWMPGQVAIVVREHGDPSQGPAALAFGPAMDDAIQSQSWGQQAGLLPGASMACVMWALQSETPSALLDACLSLVSITGFLRGVVVGYAFPSH